MSSLFTNNAAMTAQLTLRLIGQDLDKTNDVISTGLRIAGASDNAAYWSIATTMRQDNAAVGAVKDSIGEGLGVVSLTYSAVNSIIGEMEKIKAKLTDAKSVGLDRQTIQNDLTTSLQSIRSFAANATQAGESWLSVDSTQPTYAAVRKIVSGFTRILGQPTVTTTDVDTSQVKLYDAAFATAAGATALGTVGTSASSTGATAWHTAQAAYEAAEITYSTSDHGTTAIANWTSAQSAYTTASTAFQTALKTANASATGGTDGTAGGLLDKQYAVFGADNDGFKKAYLLSLDKLDISAVQPTDLSRVNAYLALVDKVSTALTKVAGTLGSIKGQLQSFQNYTESLIKANETSIGILVDGDMEEESTKLKALQVQQQLGIQSLTIANQNTQQILSLFRS